MKHNDNKENNRQIRNTSPFTKLRNPTNKLLHHQAKQAIHQLHNTNFFSNLMKIIYFSQSSSNANKINKSLTLYLWRKLGLKL